MINSHYLRDLLRSNGASRVVFHAEHGAPLGIHQRGVQSEEGAVDGGSIK